MQDSARVSKTISKDTFFYGPLHGHLPPISKTIQVRQKDVQDSAGVSKMILKDTFFYGPLHDHLPPISKTIQVRQTRRAGQCWRSKDDLKRHVLLWTSTRPLTSNLRDVPVSADLQELIYISSVRTLSVVWKTYRERWMIGTDV